MLCGKPHYQKVFRLKASLYKDGGRTSKGTAEDEPKPLISNP